MTVPDGWHHPSLVPVQSVNTGSRGSIHHTQEFPPRTGKGKGLSELPWDKASCPEAREPADCNSTQRPLRALQGPSGRPDYSPENTWRQVCRVGAHRKGQEKGGWEGDATVATWPHFCSKSEAESQRWGTRQVGVRAVRA